MEMANYSKRDARAAWVADMAAHRGDGRGGSPLPKCSCGRSAVIGFYPERGAARFFCETHQAEADAQRVVAPPLRQLSRMTFVGMNMAAEERGDERVPRYSGRESRRVQT